jgi:hypothetical protein
MRGHRLGGARNAVGIEGAEVAADDQPHATNVSSIPGPSEIEETSHDDLPSVFVAMPFDPAFDDVFFIGIRRAVDAVGACAIRVDQLMHGGDAAAETVRRIAGCNAVIADVSGSVADVLYEVGRAHALGKPTIQICSTPYDQLPFMVRNYETLFYVPGRTYVLTQQLQLYLSHVMRRS